MSVGDYYAYSNEDILEIRQKHKVYFLAVSSHLCEKCCQGEIVLDQLYKAFQNKEVAYKGDSIPMVRVNYHNFTGI